MNNVVDGNWHHVVVDTGCGSGNVAIYVDGVSQALVADLGSTTAADTTNTGESFNIGYDNGSAYLTSVVDEARVSTYFPICGIGSATEYHNEEQPVGLLLRDLGTRHTGGTAPVPTIAIRTSYGFVI